MSAHEKRCPACNSLVPSGVDECPSCGIAFNADPVPTINVGSTSLAGVPDLSERHYLARAAESRSPIAKIGFVLLLLPLAFVLALMVCAGLLGPDR
jgi:hypothetical protein